MAFLMVNGKKVAELKTFDPEIKNNEEPQILGANWKEPDYSKYIHMTLEVYEVKGEKTEISARILMHPDDF